MFTTQRKRQIKNVLNIQRLLKSTTMKGTGLDQLVIKLIQ